MSEKTVLRRAIDASGRLGSFYDIRQDDVLKNEVPQETVAPLRPSLSIAYDTIYVSSERSENVLAKIGIDDDLRRNILFRSELRTGIAALIDHYTATDRITRYIHIHYSDREYRLSEKLITRRIREKPTSLDKNKATHIITAMSYGFDIVVAFQLPSNEKDLIHKIDDALHRIRECSKSAQGFSNWITKNAEILHQINEIKVYSNIPDLTEKASLHDTCLCINELKEQPDRHCPFIYTLQSIEWLYRDVIESCIPYEPIKKSDSDKLEEYLMDIFECNKTIKHKLNSLGSKELAGDLKEQVRKSQEKWEKLKEAENEVIHRLRNSVMQVQHCRENSSNIDELLQHHDQTMFRKNIRKLANEVTTFEDKTVSSGDQERQSFHQTNIPPKETDPNGIRPTLLYEQTKTASHLAPKDQSNSTSTETKYNTEGKTINILLLGESGVGKSTFINAFINYLVFQTLKQAESATPVVLIPVSFLITTGHNFEEHEVKFGDFNRFNNEDFDHPGQSVTQQCRSYLFRIDPHKQVKCRIIDTPGFGDTRGINQDDLNMQHILEYINQYDHFDAVCFLLKPNASQINSFLRVYLTQLLDLLGPRIRENIIFCFTSARSTFYTPGDTAPLLKTILHSLPTKDVPFRKYNTFCFDNESFRYLVALQNSIPFDDQDRQEYKMSWVKSVDESKRLYRYIDEDLLPCHRQDDYQSMKGAEIAIKLMVRPILESIRNIIRNYLLHFHSPQNSIKLKAKPITYPSHLCLRCKHIDNPIGPFWIAEDELHEIRKKHCPCGCAVDQQEPISYRLEYEYAEKPSRDNQDQVKGSLSLLYYASAKFAYFFLRISRSTTGDPFLSGLIQMIDEENDICKRRESNEMNRKLVEELRKCLRTYEERMEKLNSAAKEINLSDIYKQIQAVCEYDEVTVQMNAIKKTQARLMKLNEYELAQDLTKNSFH